MKQLIRFTVCLSSLFLLLFPQKLAIACGFYVYPGEYRFWLLQPDLTNEKDLTPFFFSSGYLYNGDQYAGVETYKEENINDWHKAMRGSASRADIDSLLYHTDPQDYFDADNEVAGNSFYLALQKSEYSAYREYMTLAKKVEQIATYPDPWGENITEDENIGKVITECRELLERTRSEFIRLRTAYQLVRLYSYNGQGNKVESTYDAYVAPLRSKSWVKSAALYQKAIHSPGPAYDYLLSKVFDAANYYRTHCLVRFNSKDLDSILPLAKNAHERNVLQAMFVFNYPGPAIEKIKYIYATEPTYRELPFLLLREINKIEDWLVTSKVTDFAPAVQDDENYAYDAHEYRKLNHETDLAYARELYELIVEMTGNKKQSRKALLHVFASHLSLITGEYDRSRRHLVMAEKAGKLPANFRTQLRINRLLLELHKEKKLSPVMENELLSILLTPGENLGIYDPEIMKDQLILYVGQTLIRYGEKAKGYLMLAQTRRALGNLPIGTYKTVYQVIEETANASDLEELTAILDKKSKNPFEKFFTKKSFRGPSHYRDWYDEYDTTFWDRSKVLDIKASYYLRKNNLHMALVTMNRIPDSFLKREPYKTYIGGDPFFVNVNDAHRIREEDKVNLDKREVVAAMISLHKAIRDTPSKAALYYFMLGNAWYNMSYYGKNWLMVKQWWSGAEFSEYYGLKRTGFNDDYFGNRRARDYYYLALRASKEKELSALSAYMIAHCDWNFSQYRLYCGEKVATDKFPDWTVYKTELTRKGIDKEFYERMVSECPLYVDYTRRYAFRGVTNDH